MRGLSLSRLPPLLLILVLPFFPAWAWSADTLAVGDGERVRVLLAAERETVLSSRIAGRIERMTVGDGDRFQRGQVLVAMECVVHRARLDKARAELAAARAKLAVQTQLQALRSGSALEISLAQANLDRARAEEAEMAAIVGMCAIQAPYDGRVVARRANAFQSVTQGQPLLEILDDRALEARLIIPSRWLGWLRPGHPFTITLDETGKSYPARVHVIGARIDPASQSLTLIGRLDAAHPELIAGMSGEAWFFPPPPAGPASIPPRP